MPSSSKLTDRMHSRIAELESNFQLRDPKSLSGVNLRSNDYLGLAAASVLETSITFVTSLRKLSRPCSEYNGTTIRDRASKPPSLSSPAEQVGTKNEIEELDCPTSIAARHESTAECPLFLV